ncbi:hypothetical protein OVA14_05730 [Agrococcus sp. SL85]|uniref:hypothetical protein n=1 Tax=Agrococcus sp. SL85 TaxID=2995141 RepID=UPI00226D066F|nr:hypothetical protein [Agrococcus sp. SL85]WAC67237.1 hypothetical protein OVA14_05730 [Agrococcus sp. SL85]
MTDSAALAAPRAVPVGAHPAAHAVAVTAARWLAAVALHAVGFALLAWAVDPVIGETGDWGWPRAALVEQYGLLWAQTTVVPALVWLAYGLGRAALRRRVEGTAFVLSAGVVGLAALVLAMPLVVLQVPVQAVGMAISAWCLAGAAGVVVVAAVARTARRARAAAARASAA